MTFDLRFDLFHGHKLDHVVHQLVQPLHTHFHRARDLTGFNHAGVELIDLFQGLLGINQMTLEIHDPLTQGVGHFTQVGRPVHLLQCSTPLQKGLQLTFHFNDGQVGLDVSDVVGAQRDQRTTRFKPPIGEDEVPQLTEVWVMVP
ncbi:hypothetical protein D3C78_1051530 [compost metagenome]